LASVSWIRTDVVPELGATGVSAYRPFGEAAIPLIELTTRIDAPIDRVFDLSRSIDAHVASNTKAPERPVAGTTSGLIGLGEEVVWQARRFGITQRLHVRITAFDRPNSFTDEMVAGAFQSMKHIHRFTEECGVCIMTDEFNYRAPFGPLGRIVEWTMLTRFMRSFLIERNRVLKAIAESDRWRAFLPDA
jgi:ligand-binding SRPBCC domain-containing protein